jgi:putative ABC transport system substrate-binding protein
MLPRLRYWIVVLLFVTVTSAVYTADARSETIGVIVTHREAFQENAYGFFLSRLKSLGYFERLDIITQRPHADPMAWSNASRKLIAEDVDAMVTFGSPATLSAINEKSGIPIIYLGVYETVAAKINERAAKGICSKYSISSLLRYIRDSIAGRKVGIIFSNLERESKYQHMEISILAQKYGFNTVPINIRNPLDTAGKIAKVDIDSMLITSSSMANIVFPTILRIAKTRNIPVASVIYREESLPTIMLTSDPEDHGNKAAEKLIELLNGTPLAEIRSSCSRKIELVFNAKEAREMGFKIPMDLVTEATKIIY